MKEQIKIKEEIQKLRKEVEELKEIKRLSYNYRLLQKKKEEELKAWENFIKTLPIYYK